tara:strand:+ start:3269 stop:3814 length:546 start_codon:yes stop_codon:yes gene_type:complete
MQEGSRKTTVFDLREGADIIVASRSLVEDEEITAEEFNAVLLEWASQAGDKFMGLRAYRRALLRKVESCASEIAMFKKHKKRLEKDLEWIDQLTQTLLSAVKDVDGRHRVETMDGGWIKLAPVRSERIEIDEVTDVPPKWMRITAEPNKAEIKRAIKAGEAIPGVRLVEVENKRVTWGREK